MTYWAIILCIIANVADGYNILHIADFHLDKNYSIHGDNQRMCHEEGNTDSRKSLGYYGDYMCDAPEKLVHFAIEESYRIFPEPDLILWTGDNVAHIDSYNERHVTDVFNLTTELLFNRFPNTTILPTFGNHDYAPANNFESDSSLYQSVWNIWKERIGAENKVSFMRGGYYKYRLSENTTALVLNTNLYYNANKAYENFTSKADPAGQFAFMEEELKNAEKCVYSNEVNCTSMIHIVAHIGPGVFERTPNYTWFRDEYNERFLNLTIRYASTIGLMLFGHHHTDTFHIVKDSKGTPVQLAIMSPAVTPWFSNLNGAGANNPTFRLYKTDENYHIDDIITYYINLEDLNNNKTNQFKEEYSFKDAYKIKGAINANSMSKVVDDMKKNDKLFQTYINYNSALWDPKMPEGIYKGAQLCSLEHSDYPSYYKCLETYNSAMGFSLLKIIAPIVYYSLFM